MTAPTVIDLGGARLQLVSGGALRLDGGAMFGIIPRPLWERNTPADSQHRIQLACNCLLIELNGAAGLRALVEVGHGPKFDAKEQGMFAIDPDNWLASTLKRMDVARESISDVVLTHLHFDHAGGLTHSDGGQPQPTFPKARVHAQRREFEDARANFGIMTNTYREENFAPLDQAESWRLVEGEQCILSSGGVELRSWMLPGHTRGHQAVILAGRDQTLVFPGDVIPTAAHIGRAWNMGYDLFPIDNRNSKEALLRRAAERGWLIALDHEPATPLVRCVAERGWYRLTPA